MNTINMEVDNREGKMPKPDAPPNKEKSLWRVSQSEGDDIDFCFGDDVIGVEPIEDLDEVLLDEKDPNKVIKVRKQLKVETKILLVEIYEE